MKYDFSGYATKNGLLCSDGRVIQQGAFAEADGATVPLVWQHAHNDVGNVLGHAMLENRSDGVYAYGTFNETENGKRAKALVEHGDITALSIYANQLQHSGNTVTHGTIREVSLVLAGANPGALIDNVAIAHGDSMEVLDDEAVIYTGENILMHADEDTETVVPEVEEIAHADSNDSDDDSSVADILGTLNEDQMGAVGMTIGGILHDAGIDQDEYPEPDEDANLQHAFDSMSDQQRDAAYFFIAATVSDYTNAQNDSEDDDSVEHSANEDEEYIMHSNVFDGSATTDNGFETLSHDAMDEVISLAQRNGSLKQAWADYADSHELAHGIVDIDNFFPEPKTLSQQPPAFISRRMAWVGDLLNATHKSPFSRIRTMGADITMDEARARGYIKGQKKVEEQFTNFRRTTTPQTVYKLQKLDRDDIIDITDFDVVAWIKGEMRMMLDEEIARAILVGDGRLASDNAKIKEDNIRPIWTDDDLYTIKATVNKGTTDRDTALEFIDACVKARKNYLGSGTPTLFIGTDLLVEMRLLKDADGYRLYKSDADLANDLRVSRIVEVQLLDNLTREGDDGEVKLGGIIVNPADYTVGANKGGEVTLFDDFDIDYNKYTYLIETRICGALTQPYSAIAVEIA